MTVAAWLMNLDFAASGAGAVTVYGSASRLQTSEPVWTNRWRGSSNGLQWIEEDAWKKSPLLSPA